MGDILVSIIVPIYNADSYLRKCLDSVTNQTWLNTEIILVNDGSTDSSKEIIEDYAARDKRIIKIQKENGGIGSAYKAAFKVMTGDYVLFVDSDDWLELNAVKELVNHAIVHDADMVHFGRRKFDEKGNEVTDVFPTIEGLVHGNDKILNIHFDVLKHPSLVRLFKKNLFQSTIVFEQNVGIDEMLIVQLLSKCNTSFFTNKNYYNVLAREDSVCRRQYTPKTIQETIDVYRFICRFMDDANLDFSSHLYVKYYKILINLFKHINSNGQIYKTDLKKQISEDLKICRKNMQHPSNTKRLSCILYLEGILVILFTNYYGYAYSVVHKIHNYIKT